MTLPMRVSNLTSKLLTRFKAVESGVHGVPLDDVGEDSEQHGEGRGSDGEIELDAGH